MVDIGAAARQARSLEHLEHRPWPVPARRWAMGQTWEDVLFAHWRVPPAAVRASVRPELEVEQHDGSVWLGIVALRLTGLRARGTLPLPGVSSFLQLNVRTYVRAADGKAGIWLFSADASSRLAVEAARRAYRLPYAHARMTAARRGEWIDVECARREEPGRAFSGSYRPVGEAFRAETGSLEWFLTERYCVYATGRDGRLHRAEVHHDRWQLRRAEAEIELASIAPLELRGAPLCHCASRLDVVLWPLEPVG